MARVESRLEASIVAIFQAQRSASRQLSGLTGDWGDTVFPDPAVSVTGDSCSDGTVWGSRKPSPGGMETKVSWANMVAQLQLPPLNLAISSTASS